MTTNRETINPVIPAANLTADAERHWWDEVGVLVEHEVWHLSRLADEQNSIR
jgi:hypothetical protein